MLEILADGWVRIKVKCSRYRPGVAQRVGRGIALLFHDRGTRRGWVVSSTPRPHFTPGKDPLSILQEAGWAPGPVWTGVENLVRTGIWSRTVQAVAQSLYRLSYRAHRRVVGNLNVENQLTKILWRNAENIGNKMYSNTRGSGDKYVREGQYWSRWRVATLVPWWWSQISEKSVN